MISGSSVLIALCLYTALLLVVCCLRRFTPLLKRGGVAVLLLLSAFAAVRLLLPVEVPFSHVVPSWNGLGALLKFFRTYPAVTRFLVAVWAVGAVIAVGIDIFALYRSHKRCRGYTIVESGAVQEIAKRLSIPCPVLVSPDVEIPYVAGIFRHTIYFPVLDLPEKEIELALAHEAQHIRTHDALIKLFFGLLSAAMWWNLVVRWFRREIDALLELRCDAKVTEHMDEQGRVDYAEMLKDIAAQVVSKRRVPALALDESPAVGGANVLTQRVNVILYREDKLSRRVSVAALCLMVVLFLASYLVLFVPAGAPPTEDLQDDSRTSYDESFDGSGTGDGANSTFILKKSDGRYQLFVDYRFDRYLTDSEVALDQYQNLCIYEEEGQE